MASETQTLFGKALVRLQTCTNHRIQWAVIHLARSLGRQNPPLRYNVDQAKRHLDLLNEESLNESNQEWASKQLDEESLEQRI